MNCKKCNPSFLEKIGSWVMKFECTCGMERNQISRPLGSLQTSIQPLECQIAIIGDLTKEHWRFCNKCQLKFENIVKDRSWCFSCLKKQQIFELPTCRNHQFCTDCINSRKTIQLLCLNCEKFFRSSEKGKNYCFFCVEHLKDQNIWQIKCHYHAYCRRCISFFERNPIANTDDFTKCSCYNNLQKLNMRSKRIMESSPPYRNEIDLSDKATLYDSFTDLKPEEGYLFSTLPANKNVSNCINCKNIENINKLRIICQNSEHLHCEKCIYFMNTARVLDCQFCASQFNLNKKQALYQTTSSSNYRIQNIPNQSDTRSLINPLGCSLAVYSSFCDVCKQAESLKSFCCNHSYCVECLMDLCCRQINSFWTEFNKNPNIYYQQFKYYCERNCNKVIRVPSAMIIIHLKELTAENYRTPNIPEFHERKKKFQHVLGYLTKEWACHFEGVKPS